MIDGLGALALVRDRDLQAHSKLVTETQVLSS